GPHHGQPVTGRLGLHFDTQAYETRGRFRITAVTALSPAAVSGEIRPGDYLLAIDGQKLGAQTNLAQSLNYHIGRETKLRIAQNPSGDDAITVKVKPIETSQLQQLIYRAWVQRNRAYVAHISHGQLGYIH